MATFVRNHPEVSAATSGTTVATALSAEVPAGNTLIAMIGNAAGSGVTGSSTPPSGLSKAAGETADWVMLKGVGVTTADGDVRAGMSIWIIRTTVSWPSAQAITATWTESKSHRSIAVGEFLGVSTEVLASDDDGKNDNAGNPTISVDTGPVARAGDLVVQVGIVQFSTLAESSGGTAPAGARQSLATAAPGSGRYRLYGAGYLITGTGNRTATYTGDSRSKGAAIVALKAVNYPPNAPTLTSMASGGVIDRNNTNRASHSFSDPNPGDSQSAFDLRYRIVGAPTWTTVNVPLPNQFYDFPAASLAAGDYERQVRTYDALGAVGPYSTSGFFTAADAPAGPSITAPTNGSTVEATAELVWSTATQDAYQVRRVADDAGTPDTDTIYEDTGEVTAADVRTMMLTFAVNNRTEHVQVRVKYDDLWSEWVSIAVDVSYTPPPVPSLILSADPATASLLLTITNPGPEGDDPAAAYNDVWIDDGTGEERKATGLSTNTDWRYWTPISGRDYAGAVRVVAVASNGTTSSST